MWKRQVETRDIAVREMAEKVAEGYEVRGPFPDISPNRRSIWCYECSIDKVSPTEK